MAVSEESEVVSEADSEVDSDAGEEGRSGMPCACASTCEFKIGRLDYCKVRL